MVRRLSPLALAVLAVGTVATVGAVAEGDAAASAKNPAAAVVSPVSSPGSVAAVPGTSPDPRTVPDTLRHTLRAHARSMRLDAGRLSGPGAEWLLDEARRAPFVLLGEEHGVAEIPALAAALFDELATTADYRHLAIETGDGVAAALDSLAREPDPVAAMTDWYQAHWPGAPFFTLREEAELVAHAVESSPAPQVLWGLDYDIMADRHALPRLRTLAESDAERSATDDAIATADSLLRHAMEEPNPGRILMFAGPESVLSDLREAWDPEPGSEPDRILSLMEATLRVNAHWGAGEILESNRERARWNKTQFARMWRSAGEPRVLFKFGANHMLRGRNFTGVFDLGTLASELADAMGSRSFHLAVLAGRDTESAAMDPTVMEYHPRPSGAQAEAWAAPFFDALEDLSGSGPMWTIFDLRPLRPLAHAGLLEDLPDRLEAVIWGFDALLVLPDSRPATMLPIERPW
jgi:hypothetical protein